MRLLEEEEAGMRISIAAIGVTKNLNATLHSIFAESSCMFAIWDGMVDVGSACMHK